MIHDEPFENSWSCAVSLVAAAVSGRADELEAARDESEEADLGAAREVLPCAGSSSISLAFLGSSGLGCWAVSRSFWWMRSSRAASTGAKTRARSFARLDFLTLDRRPFAIVKTRTS